MSEIVDNKSVISEMSVAEDPTSPSIKKAVYMGPDNHKTEVAVVALYVPSAVMDSKKSRLELECAMHKLMIEVDEITRDVLGLRL